MTRATVFFAGLLALCASTAFGQVVVSSSPVVVYDTPAVPVVAYSSPTVSSSAIVSTPVVAAPVTMTPAVTTYYAPAVTTYYGSTVVTPVYGRPVTVGRSAYGTLRTYVPGQPVRNALRFTVP